MRGAGSEVGVIGGGIVGLSCAMACAARGMQVTLISPPGAVPGYASIAAAGMLAPSVHPPGDKPDPFALAARDYYPEFIAELEERSGIRIPLSRAGIIELLDLEKLVSPKDLVGPGRLLSPGDLRSLEPAFPMKPGRWGFLHEQDGWVDNTRLLDALEECIRRTASITRIPETVVRLEFSGTGVSLLTASGTSQSCDQVILAAGAWAGGLAGLPRALPVQPLKGQMLLVEAPRLKHVLIAADGYAVPRPPNHIILGSTMEQTGFDATLSDEGITLIRSGAGGISAALATSREVSRWAGLRPVTPDFQPILGRDPDEPRLTYACGHGRNGILLGPYSARCVADLLTDAVPAPRIGKFCISRFD